LIVRLILSLVNLPYTNFTCAVYRFSCPYFLAWVVYPKGPSKSKALLNVSYQTYIVRWMVVSPPPNPQAWGPPHVVCPRLLIQYIRTTVDSWRPSLRPQS
jgi:hypothetical protein